jgi:hypothetical protein
MDSVTREDEHPDSETAINVHKKDYNVHSRSRSLEPGFEELRALRREALAQARATVSLSDSCSEGTTESTDYSDRMAVLAENTIRKEE